MMRRAINWLDHLPAGSISTWDDLTTRFLAQFFPSGRTAKLRNDILMFQQHQDESLYDAWTHFKDLLQKFPHHGLDLWLQVQIFYDRVNSATQMAIDYAAGGRRRKLRPEVAWETIEDLAQYEEEKWNDPIFSEKGSPDYINVTLKQELESMECQVESLMRSKVLLDYKVRFMFPERPYQKEFKGRILNLIDHQEDQIRQLEEDMRKTKGTFVCLADSLIATLKVKIEAQQVHFTKIEKITKFHTHTPTVTPEILKLIMVHRVSMISNIKPTIYKTPYQHLNSNLKMPILHSFKENKLEYKDDDEVEIKMMGTGMNKESLEHNLYENDITPIIYDPKKHYGFNPGLLGHSGYSGVDLSNMEMIEDDWQLESKEVYFLGEGLNLPKKHSI
ncbi:zinc finger, CCHC-type containing protein [Tanacetum coccineum]